MNGNQHEARIVVAPASPCQGEIRAAPCVDVAVSTPEDSWIPLTLGGPGATNDPLLMLVSVHVHGPGM